MHTHMWKTVIGNKYFFTSDFTVIYKQHNRKERFTKLYIQGQDMIHSHTNPNICVCVCVCVRVCVCVCVYTHTHPHTHVFVYTRIPIQIHIHVYKHIGSCTQISKCMYICLYNDSIYLSTV